MENSQEEALNRAVDFTGLKAKQMNVDPKGLGYSTLVNIGFKILKMEAVWGKEVFRSKVRALELDPAKQSSLNKLGAEAFLPKNEKTYNLESDPFLKKVGIIQYIANQENQKQK